MSIGGIPLLYLGDELATLNDYGYHADPARAADSRWVHRPSADPAATARRADPSTPEGRMWQGLRRLIAVRTANPVFASAATEVVDLGTDAVFGYVRRHGDARALVLANFTEREQAIGGNLLRRYGLAYRLRDLLTDEVVEASADLTLGPYGLLWLVATEQSGDRSREPGPR